MKRPEVAGSPGPFHLLAPVISLVEFNPRA
jgi:hypothetical protein